MNMVDSIYEARTGLAESQLKVPSKEDLGNICTALLCVPDFKFPRIRLDHRRAQYELPTSDDGTKLRSEFQGVILVAQQLQYQSEDEAQDGIVRVKLRLYVLRNGRTLPEIMYVSPSAVRNFGDFTRPLSRVGLSTLDVMCQFTIEQAHALRFTWSKPVFKIAGVLSGAEAHYVEALRDLVRKHMQEAW